MKNITVEYTYRHWEADLVPVFSSTILFMDKILHLAAANYIRTNKLYTFREICFGFLHIGRNNSQATLMLLEANLVDQIHYISRNTFEMALTLYFIDNDKSTRDSLAQRFKDYRCVVSHKVKNKLGKYKSIFGEMTKEEDDAKIEKDYKTFISKYGCDKNQLQTWSGKKMDKMIDILSDEELKSNMLRHYDLVTWANNMYLHANPLSLQESIRKYLRDEIDYKNRVMLLGSVFTTVLWIIEKALEQFSKNRIELTNDLSVIKKQHEEINQRARFNKLLM
jgi:hypothetical protein